MFLSDMVDVANKLVYFQAINRFWIIKLDRKMDDDERFTEGCRYRILYCIFYFFIIFLKEFKFKF